MRYTNAYIFMGENGFCHGSMEIRGGKFCSVSKDSKAGSPDSADDTLDMHGAKILPGLVDCHIHGALGADFSDGSAAGLKTMAGFLATHGITSFAPTSMTLPYEKLAAAFKTAAELREAPDEGCAKIAGIHMEGPFLSENKKGAQNSAWLNAPDFAAFSKLFSECGGIIRIVDIAPELPGSISFIDQAASLCTISIAHTDADYKEASAAFDAGASHVTHLFNAMPPLLHRDPGVIGAASERPNVTAELICDGIHVHESAVRAAFRLFPGRICLISDALRCLGMPNGEYESGGHTVTIRGGAARLPDGTLAGAVSDLYSNMLNAIRFGIPETDAITAATLTPARALGVSDVIGSIEPGKIADFLICDDDLSLRQVWIGGKHVC